MREQATKSMLQAYLKASNWIDGGCTHDAAHGTTKLYKLCNDDLLLVLNAHVGNSVTSVSLTRFQA